MGRSLFGTLHRRYGRSPRGAERKRRADAYRERLQSVMPFGALSASRPLTSSPPASVAVIGAGLAGCCAAYLLAESFNFDVTIFDPAGVAGGRVSTSYTVVPNRILETGAELIGLNHPVWLSFARKFGFEMGTVTPDDDSAGAGLLSPLLLTVNGIQQSFNESQQAALYDAMSGIFGSWTSTAMQNVINPWAPWGSPNAALYDSMTLEGQMSGISDPAVLAAINTTFLFNNCQPPSQQSWLANMAQFAAGQALSPAGETQGFFDDTEVFRSTAGNQALASALVQNVPFMTNAAMDLDTTSGAGVTITFADNSQRTFDYAVVAVPVTLMGSLTVDRGNPFPFEPIQGGDAVKYFAPLASRFWITESPTPLAPSGMSDTLGMTWEGTDNQAVLQVPPGTAQFDLTVFVGGPLATAALQAQGSPGFPDAFFQGGVAALYPGFQVSAPGAFCCANANGYTMAGYSCPNVNQVTGATASQFSYATPYNERLYLAGEHTSPAWFGFMEGALESGLAAALRIAIAADVEVPESWGGTSALALEC